MCTQVRFSLHDFPSHLREDLENFRLDEEIQMHVRHPKAALLIEHQGQYQVTPWGNQTEARLPKTGFCKEESLAEGHWQWLHPTRVRIPALAGWTNGVWFQVKIGLHGILVFDQKHHPHTYLLTRPSSHYFQTMTGSPRMPSLIDQVL